MRYEWPLDAVTTQGRSLPSRSEGKLSCIRECKFSFGCDGSTVGSPGAAVAEQANLERVRSRDAEEQMGLSSDVGAFESAAGLDGSCRWPKSWRARQRRSRAAVADGPLERSHGG
jgi:hypothetical protein